MKKTLLLVFLVLLTCAFLNAASLKEIQEKGKLVLLTQSYNNFFFYNEDKTPAGMDYEVAQEIAKSLGVELEVKYWEDWDDIIPALIRGEGDIIIAGMTITDERKEKVNFSDGYFMSKIMVVTRKDLGINTLNDLTGKKAAIQKGTTFEEAITDKIKDVNFEYVVSADDQIPSVAGKKADFTAVDLPEAISAVKVNKDLKIVAPISGEQAFGIAVPKGSDELLKKINSTLLEMKKDGRYKKIYDKYFSY